VRRPILLLALLLAGCSGHHSPSTGPGSSALCPPPDTHDCASVQTSWTRLDVCLRAGATTRDLLMIRAQAESARRSWETLRPEPVPTTAAILVEGVPGDRVGPTAAGVTCSSSYVRVGEIYLAGGHETLRHELVHVLCRLGHPAGIPCSTVEHPGSVDLAGNPITAALDHSPTGADRAT